MPQSDHVDSWLDTVGITLLSEWDVLIFLYRHGTSLTTAENIATLLGYTKPKVGRALDALERLGLVKSSRSSRGVRLYRLIDPPESSCRESLEQLLNLSASRGGRLILAGRLSLRSQPVSFRERDGWRLA